MNTVTIVQARTGSTRLPDKVLTDIAGHSMLDRVVHRAARARSSDRLVVATTTARADRRIVQECEALGVGVFRGHEEDVLDRFYRAARAFDAGRVVRVTADCPLIDPELIDQVVEKLDVAAGEEPVDYVSNQLERTFPRGLDVEAMTFATLERAWREAREPFQRIHVTPYIYQNGDLFRRVSVTHGKDLHHHRWTVDTAEDLALIRALYERLGGDDRFSWTDALAIVEAEPELTELNRHVRQKKLEEG